MSAFTASFTTKRRRVAQWVTEWMLSGPPKASTTPRTSGSNWVFVAMVHFLSKRQNLPETQKDLRHSELTRVSQVLPRLPGHNPKSHSWRKVDTHIIGECPHKVKRLEMCITPTQGLATLQKCKEDRNPLQIAALAPTGSRQENSCSSHSRNGTES